MSWTMLAIRAWEDDGPGVLYPIPTPETNGLRLEEADGTISPPVIATQLSLDELVAPNEKKREVLKAESIKANVFITDCRVAVVCTKYDKGGGWVGGATALAFNAASKARAAVRRRGKSLVGHIRYPWLASVMYAPKMGFGGSEQIRLTAVDKTGPEKTTYYLYLHLPKTTSAEKVAGEITRRAAAYRLATTKDPSNEEREKLELLLDPPARTPEKGKLVGWTFPTHYFARTSTAYGDVDD